MMKKLLITGVLALIMALACALPAWGETYQGAVPSEFAEAFSGDRWAGYSVAAGFTFYPAGDNSAEGVPAFFVMEKGDENVLCILEHRSGAWKLMVQSPKPLYQGSWVPVFEDEDDYNWFSLYYRDQNPDEGGKEDVLRFFRDNKGVWRFLGLAQYDFGTGDSLYINARATDGDWTPGVLYVTKITAGRTVYEAKPVYGTYENDLRYFSLSAFPRSLEEARDKLTNPPDIPGGELQAQLVQFTSGEKYPVYSGPGALYHRAAGGKAAVSTNDWIQVFGVEDGWALIQYDISASHMRIGYVDASALPKGASVPLLQFTPQTMVLSRDAALTDDPLFSKETVLQLKQGQELIRLSSLGAEWAYVEVMNSQTAMRGFVPENALMGKPNLSLIPGGPYSDTREFDQYQAKAVVTRAPDGSITAIHVYAALPQAWKAPASGVDALVGYRLYEGNRASHQLSGWEEDQGMCVFHYMQGFATQADVLGLVPVYALSGEKAEESLIIPLH
jgi:hypothetical protein